MKNFKSVVKRGYITLAAATVLLVSPALAQISYSLNDELIYRINFGRADDVKLLISKGANPNTISSTGEYALTVAIARDDSEAANLVKILLDGGASPNIHDKANPYPIISAAINNKTQIVADLLAKGADYHVVSPNGRTLLQIAKANKNPDIEKLIQEQVNIEKMAADKLRTPERLVGILHQYVFDSCAYQYWNFILGSRQNPEKDNDIKTRVLNLKTDLATQIGQVQQYFPNTPSTDLQHLSDDASHKIYAALNAMISNTNRAALGVGTEADANTRCHVISDSIHVDFPPSALAPAAPTKK